MRRTMRTAMGRNRSTDIDRQNRTQSQKRARSTLTFFKLVTAEEKKNLKQNIQNYLKKLKELEKAKEKQEKESGDHQ